jgi:hypothetical protein
MISIVYILSLKVPLSFPLLVWQFVRDLLVPDLFTPTFVIHVEQSILVTLILHLLIVWLFELLSSIFIEFCVVINVSIIDGQVLFPLVSLPQQLLLGFKFIAAGPWLAHIDG